MKANAAEPCPITIIKDSRARAEEGRGREESDECFANYPIVCVCVSVSVWTRRSDLMGTPHTRARGPRGTDRSFAKVRSERNRVVGFDARCSYADIGAIYCTVWGDRPEVGGLSLM